VVDGVDEEKLSCCDGGCVDGIVRGGKGEREGEIKASRAELVYLGSS